VSFAKTNGIEIAYEEFGDHSAPAILLIMGLGVQLTGWREPFCERLASAGFWVLRYDNRDTGLSTKFPEGGEPNMGELFQRAMRGEPIEASYTLVDMASDGVGLLDALGIAQAHIVGASMGGMIAQIIAADHPDRTSGLVSIMSTSGRPGLPPGKPEAFRALMMPPADGARETVVEQIMLSRRTIGSPGFPEDEAILRRQVEASYDRCYYPQGMARQTAAILKSGSRVERLERIHVPSLVIHGVDDPLVPVEAGKDTAATIEGAELLLIEGMGHGLESPLEMRIADAIIEFCSRQRCDERAHAPGAMIGGGQTDTLR
jgi:pimeloyl-ACP methyl ester carboxylesterase